MKKKYVNIKDNKEEQYMRKFFKKGDTVIIVDGSYMYKEDLSPAYGYMFHEQDNYELLTIIGINKPLPTRLEPRNSEILTPFNNCVIQSNSGEKYYCSSVNMIRYKS